MRVTHYEGTAYYTSTGSSDTKLYPFLEEHAREARTVLEPDGLDEDSAKRLIAKWNERGRRGTSVRYSYSLPYRQPNIAMTTPILFKKNHPNAVMPTKGTPDAAAFDLTLVDAHWENNILVCDTGLSVAFPAGYVLKVFPRSGLARKHGIRLVNSVGIVDADYRGPLLMLLYSATLSNDQLEALIQPGARIAQCILERLPEAAWQEVAELPDSVRGENGFGSTGVR